MPWWRATERKLSTQCGIWQGLGEDSHGHGSSSSHSRSHDGGRQHSSLPGRFSPGRLTRHSGERHALAPAPPPAGISGGSPHGDSACLMERPRGLLPVQGSARLSQDEVPGRGECPAEYAPSPGRGRRQAPVAGGSVCLGTRAPAGPAACSPRSPFPSCPPVPGTGTCGETSPARPPASTTRLALISPLLRASRAVKDAGAR